MKKNNQILRNLFNGEQLRSKSASNGIIFEDYFILNETLKMRILDIVKVRLNFLMITNNKFHSIYNIF